MATKKDSSNVLPVLTHILALFTYFIGPLIILLSSKDEDVKKHAKNALNWQFSMIIYAIISMILMIVLIGFVLIIAISIIDMVFCIIAAVKAGENQLWEYPLSIKFFK